MLENRIRFKPLMEKITDPDTACLHIQNGTNVFISGFTAGYPKLIPQALVRRAEAGERFQNQSFRRRIHGGCGGRHPGPGRSGRLAPSLHEQPEHARDDQR
jgi:acyl-CoA hydrolase